MFPHIWVPKLKIVEANMARIAGFAVGYFQLEVCNRYGRVTRATEPWKQIITDLGMTAVFTDTNIHSWCHVGTGSPSFTGASTGLANSIASSSTTASASTTVDTTGSNNYRYRETVTKEFPLGSISANISEVGFFAANNNTSGNFLDVVRDSGGSPTTFPVTADDQLRVTHTLDVYPNLSDTTGSFTIGGGAGSGSHDFIGRPAQLAFDGSNLSPEQTLGVNDSGWRGYHSGGGDAGPITGDPLGTSIGTSNASVTWGAPSNDGTTWTRTATLTAGLTVWNNLNGVSGCRGDASSANGARYQFAFDPAIPKFASSIQRILTLNLSASIVRG